MGRFVFVGLIVMLMVPGLGSGSRRVLAQDVGTVTPTVTPLPTPTPTGPAGPSADDLLSAAVNAFKTHGSVRTTTKLTAMEPKVEQVTSLQTSDVSFHHTQPRYYTTGRVAIKELETTPHRKYVRNSTTIIVDQRAATRTGTTQTWTCTTLNQLSQSGSALISQIGAIVEQGNVSYATPVPDTLNGQAVWHIPALVGDIPNQPGAGVHADFYISRQNGTLLRQTLDATITVAGKSMVEHLTETYSRYGEHVRIRLPGKCARSAAVAGLSPFWGLLRVSSRAAGTSAPGR